jgi:hypothetical protein
VLTIFLLIVWGGHFLALPEDTERVRTSKRLGELAYLIGDGDLVDIASPDRSEVQDLALRIREAHSDWWLATLVDLANRSGLTMPITLSVGGLLVAGTLVGGKDYFEGVAKLVADSIEDSDLSESIRQLFSIPMEAYQPSEEPSENEDTDQAKAEDRPEPPPSFLHLRGARIWGPNAFTSIPNNEGIWWRGKIEDVDGFLFGELRAGE